MSKENSPRRYPLGPLLTQFRRERGSFLVHGNGAWPQADSLLHLPDQQLSETLRAFAEHSLPVLWHSVVFGRRLPLLRHALEHLFRGHDSFAERLARCVTPGEAYHIPGLGPGFWSRIAELIDSETPLWCPAVECGLQLLGLLAPCLSDFRTRIAHVLEGYRSIRERSPDLTFPEITDFLERVSRLEGRELPPSAATPCAFAWAAGPEEIRQAIRAVRTRLPLRQRLREAPSESVEALGRFPAMVSTYQYEAAFETFRSFRTDSFWESILPELDEAYSTALPFAERARLWCEIVAVMRERFHVHPLEIVDVVIELGDRTKASSCGEFKGFCRDTFAFLKELSEANSAEWMAANRERYRYSVRAPIVELCRAVAERYIRPVVNREFGWDLECDARPGRALTSICKNDYGRTGPYQPVQWVTYYRRSRSNKRADAQFFFRLAADGVRYGFHLGRSAREAGTQFRRNIQAHGEAIYRALAPAILLNACQFWVGDDLGNEVTVRSAADLRAWAANKTLAAGIALAPDDPSLRRDDLPGEVLLTFDRLLPLFVSAAEADPLPHLVRRNGSSGEEPPYDPASFHRETYLSEVWLDRVLSLLRIKKQLVLQGVPGTGKTHVARCLARLLTHDRPDCVRLVQFHPAYSYEEFVEGIRVRNIVTDGRDHVTYPVEDGVLCEFAAQAASRPSEPHVLIVDELNRGNLPRIFGELLFLLEYRDQAITLPYSRRSFRLPANLFLLATMNPLDRSVAVLDQALRRRFSFMDMPADAAILASWLEQHSTASEDSEAFGPRAVRVFEELNERLGREIGREKQVGHSFFMVPDLDAEKLSTIWQHHVRPLLLEYLGGREDRLREYTPERLISARSRRSLKANTSTAG